MKMVKMTPQEEARQAQADITRARMAEELLANPLYVEAIQSMEAAMFATFEDTRLEDSEQRHELWQRMQLMKQFRGKFESIVRQGDKARQTLTLLERAKQKIGI